MLLFTTLACFFFNLAGDSDRPLTGEPKTAPPIGVVRDTSSASSNLLLFLDGLILTVEHSQVTLDCDAVLINEHSIDGSEITMVYTNTPLITECSHDFVYELDFTHDNLSAGIYTFYAAGDVAAFEIPE